LKRDLDEKKKGDRITRILRTSPVIEINRPTKTAIAEAIGQRKELSKKIDNNELARIISDYFTIMLTPNDIIQVYQPDSDRVLSQFATEGVVLSGLYDIQFHTSKFSTGTVRLNLISIVDKEEVERQKQARAERRKLAQEAEEAENLKRRDEYKERASKEQDKRNRKQKHQVGIEENEGELNLSEEAKQQLLSLQGEIGRNRRERTKSTTTTTTTTDSNE
jgi:hypothetical protein